MVFTSSPVYITFTLFYSFSFLDFLILLPPFFMCPALFISPYFPCSSPFTPSTYLYINTLKKKKKVQLLVILAKELTVDFGLETLFSNILFSVSLFR